MIDHHHAGPVVFADVQGNETWLSVHAIAIRHVRSSDAYTLDCSDKFCNPYCFNSWVLSVEHRVSTLHGSKCRCISSHFVATDRVLHQCKHGMRGSSHQPTLTLYTLQHSISKPHAERSCFFRLVIPAKKVANVPCSHLISSEVSCMLTARQQGSRSFYQRSLPL
jgi:hypothetical protein